VGNSPGSIVRVLISDEFEEAVAEEELAELSETGIEDPFEEEEAEFPTSWLEETA
jgi:hypothetical protein